MAPPGTLLVHPVRFIPFDLGAPLTDRSKSQIRQHVRSNSELRAARPTLKEQTLVPESSLQFVVQPTREQTLIFDCFDDGYGIITFLDIRQAFELQAFDPVAFLHERRIVHQQILQFNHLVSNTIRTQLITLRHAVRSSSRHSRPSASPDWQYSGLAYVMSIHFIEFQHSPHLPADASATIRLAQTDPAFVRTLMAMLEPSFTGIEDTPGLPWEGASQRRILGDAASVHPVIDMGEAEIRLRNIEMRHNYITLAGWANVLILGPLTQAIFDDYVCLEKRVQHLWFLAYCLNDRLAGRVQERKAFSLDEITDIRLQMNIAVQRFRQIADASIGSRYLRLAEGLVETSLLEQQIRQAQANLDAAQAEVQYKASKRLNTYQRNIEFLLFILAFLQGVGVAASLGVFQYMLSYFVFGLALLAGFCMFLLRR